jgi:hypothetical protein
MPERIDHVRIPLARESIELPWASREALLKEFGHLVSFQPIAAEFEAVGTSRPVKLRRDDKGELVTLIEF